MNGQLAIEVKIRFLHGSAESDLPKQATPGASGFDLVAAHDQMLKVGRAKLVKTGIAVEIPRGYEAQIRSRSGLALKHGIMVLNSPGTIDSDYRGEIGVILANLGLNAVQIKKGDRIAQMVFAPIVTALFTVVDALSETDRSEGGFGSTGGLPSGAFGR